jgi:multidrug efflux pump subunit AcrA (membrane-fusion protein)
MGVSCLAAGTVSGQTQAAVQFQTSGQVKTINVKVGDHVKAGQVMASLDAASLEAAVQGAI